MKLAAHFSILLLSGISSAVCAQTLRLTFLGVDGRPLPNVESRLLPTGDQALAPGYRRSDKRGQVEFPDLEQGSYQVRAQFKDHMPLTRTIDVQHDEHVRHVLLKKKDFQNREKEAKESLHERNYDRASELLTELLTYYPEDAVLHDNLARAYAGNLDEERAIAEAEQAARLDPQFHNTKNELRRLMLLEIGDGALRQKEFDVAIDKFLELMEIAPDEPKVHEGLALAYGHQGLFELALAAVDRAIKLAPDDASLQQLRQMLLANATAQ